MTTTATATLTPTPAAAPVLRLPDFELEDVEEEVVEDDPVPVIFGLDVVTAVATYCAHGVSVAVLTNAAPIESVDKLIGGGAS